MIFATEKTPDGGLVVRFQVDQRSMADWVDVFKTMALLSDKTAAGFASKRATHDDRSFSLAFPGDPGVIQSVISGLRTISRLAPQGSFMGMLAKSIVKDVATATGQNVAEAPQAATSTTRGSKRSGFVYRGSGKSCGADRDSVGWKEKQKEAQEEAWEAGKIPTAWPRDYEPQGKPFAHGCEGPVKFSLAKAETLQRAWMDIPAARRPALRDENPRVTEIPVDRFGDPDLHWFLDGESGGKILVMFSGGKDSLALLLYIMEVCASMGLDPTEHVEAWHQAVDGKPRHLGGESSRSSGAADDYERAKWDWPVTEAYCRAVCDHLGIPLYFGWREGGLQGTVLRGEDSAALRAAAVFEIPDESGDKVLARTRPEEEAVDEDDEDDIEPELKKGANVRMSYPLTGADLRKRWCSSEVKIDVAKSQLAKRVDLRGKRILFCSGERAEESANRATYPEREFHGAFSMKTMKIKGLHGSHGRHVEKWRPLLPWCEIDVWAIIRRWGVRAHPAYDVGFGRLSCMTCIFGNEHQWASVKKLDPKRFAQFAATEVALAARQTKDVRKGVPKAEKRLITIKGTPLPIFTKGAKPYDGDWDAAPLAMSDTYDTNVRVDPTRWELPAGAFGEEVGPV